VTDPGVDVVALVQPYAARKRYWCPGCEGAIKTGEGHFVVVPEHTPELRRHWHRACWYRELRRRHGRDVRSPRLSKPRESTESPHPLHRSPP
jgi:hypothetical protein